MNMFRSERRREADLSAHDVRRVFDYNSDTGMLFWRQPSTYSHETGDVAGCFYKTGYVVVRLKGQKFLAHRLAWIHVRGNWPSIVDHINGDKGDNRIANLREVTASQNSLNRVVRRGWRYHKRDKCFIAEIQINGKQSTVGRFKTAEEAEAAYRHARLSLVPEYTRSIIGVMR